MKALYVIWVTLFTTSCDFALSNYGFISPESDLIRCMNVNEARGGCKDRGRWRSIVSAYPPEKKA